MNKISLLLSGVACLVLVGCSGSSMLSMNKRMSYADSGANLAAAVALDQVPADKFDATKAEVIVVCGQVSKFLDDGQVGDLPLDKAKAKVEEFMIKKGWQAYIGLVEVAFAWIEAQKVPTEKIGANNILIIKQGLDGVARQAARAKAEWAVPIGTTAVDTTKGKSLKFSK